MATTIALKPTMNIYKLRKAFNKEYPYLGIVVTKKPETTAPEKKQIVGVYKTLGEVNKKFTACTIDISPARKLHNVYEDFAKAGINIMFFMSEYSVDLDDRGSILQLYPTIDTKTETLNQTNAKAKKKGCMSGCF